jgi:hypothetical protein
MTGGALQRSCPMTDQDALLSAMMQKGALRRSLAGLDAKKFFERRILVDVPALYYGHPKAWSEIGFGGPASPRGYVRLEGDRRDPWEAAEAEPGRKKRRAARTSVSSDPLAAPRARGGRAPDVFRKGGWVPMREYRESDEVDFAIVGTGAGGGTLGGAARRAGLLGRGFDAGGYFRPLEDFASDETEQNKLYWTDKRVVDGPNPIQMGGKNSGKSVGGSTVHYAMVSLRFRPEWFKSRSSLGYGADWPISWQEMWHYYGEAEQQINISGPLTYPWGPKRPRYPYRAHELNDRRLCSPRAARRSASTGPRRRSPRSPRRMRDPRANPALRLSRLLPVRLLDQRQALGADRLDSARARRGRRDPRSGDGRTDRDGTGRPRDRRPLSSRGRLAFSARAQRRRRGLRDRDAAPAAQFRE